MLIPSPVTGSRDRRSPRPAQRRVWRLVAAKEQPAPVRLRRLLLEVTSRSLHRGFTKLVFGDEAATNCGPRTADK